MNGNKYFALQVVMVMVSLCMLVLCCMGIINANGMTGAELIFSKASQVLIMALVVIGLIYSIKGFGKTEAKFFKLFMMLYVIMLVLTILGVFVGSMSIVAIIAGLVSLVLAVVLALGKDLGKSKSFAFVIILIICRIAVLINGAAIYTQAQNVEIQILSVMSFLIADVLVSVTAGMMVLGKYFDKTDRGTK